MNKESKDFLEALDDWTLYVEEGNDMPYVTVKPSSPAHNILIQSDCFDEEDEEGFKYKGYMVFTGSQMIIVNDFFSRVGIAKIKYVPLEWFRWLVDEYEYG